MRVNIAQAIPPLSSPPLPHTNSPSSLFTSKNLHLHRSSSSSSLHRSKSMVQNLQRSCSASFDGHDFPQHHHHHPIEDFNRKHNTQKLNFPTFLRNTTYITTSFRNSDSQVDVLEPSLLGIRPEPPDWPARDAMIRECIARRASSIELPLSLRMIKMKQKFLKLEEESEIGDLEEHIKDGGEPINSLCCSTLYIIREIQSKALKSRGMILDEELDDGIVSKVQKEMTSSFIWLFREVFAKTPDLMLQVMVLTSDFATFSLENLQILPETQKILENEGEDLERKSRNWRGVGHLELGKSGVPTKEILEKMEESEMGLWNSMVKEANKLVKEANKLVQGGGVKDQGLGFVVDNDDHDDDELRDKKTEFVSPVRVEIEEDDYEEYYRTELLYQMGLFQDPNNTLLLSNYAQFLCLVSRDYEFMTGPRNASNKLYNWIQQIPR